MIRLLDVSQPRHLLKTRVSNQRYEPEGAEDVGVVVEGGGDGDEEEEDDHDDESEAVDDKSLKLEGSALPAKDPLKSFDSESGR